MKRSDIEKMISNMALSTKNKKSLLRLHEELIELVKRYSLILNDDMICYLQNLIDGDFSIVSSKYIKDEDRSLLSELEIYKLVAIRNIYDIICTNYYKLVKDLGHEFVSINDDNYGISVNVDIKGASVCVYKFKYDDILPLGTNIPDEYKSMNIGTLSLYHAEENINARKEKLESAMDELFRLYNAKSSNIDASGRWEYERYQKINELEKELNKLDRLNISDTKKEEIEVTTYAHDKIMEDLEINPEEFKEKSSKDVMKKVLVKQMPNLEVKDTIKYI